jgi:hypothetical protein
MSFFLLKVVGFASGRIAKQLTAKGEGLVAPPKGFIVSHSEGPMAEGVLDRAAAWADGLAEKQKAAGATLGAKSSKAA